MFIKNKKFKYTPLEYQTIYGTHQMERKFEDNPEADVIQEDDEEDDYSAAEEEDAEAKLERENAKWGKIKTISVEKKIKKDKQDELDELNRRKRIQMKQDTINSYNRHFKASSAVVDKSERDKAMTAIENDTNRCVNRMNLIVQKE